MGTGFFTRQSRSVVKKHSSRAKDPVETARRMGPAAVRRMNRSAETPEMEPWGDLESNVLVLLDAPREDDDENGRPLSCQMGRLYKRWFSKYGEFAVDHICRTLPPKGRGPNATEIAAFEGVVREHIEIQRPNVIIACGHTVTDWLIPGLGFNILIHRGRMFPVKIGDHECWVCPIIPPWQALTIFDRGTKEAYGEEFERITRKDVKAAYTMQEEPARTYDPRDFDGTGKDTIICMKPDIGAFREFLQEERRCKSLTYDVETWRNRPYYEDFRLYSFAATGDKLTISMPYDHPEAQPRNLKKLQASFGDCVFELFDGREVNAHNQIFDLEVMHFVFGDEIIDFPSAWECTQVGAFCLDHRWGQGLDYCSRLYLGFSLKALSPAALWAENFALKELLQYGAGDAKGTHVIKKQMIRQMKDEGLFDVWRFRCERIPALVQTMDRGLPVSQVEVKELLSSYQKKLAALTQKMSARDEVQEYEKKHGKFEPTAPEAVGLLFHEFLERDEVLSVGAKERGSKYATGAKVLDQLINVEPIVKDVLEHRRISKLLSTYLGKYVVGVPDSYIFPDGRVHAQFSTTRADGGRLACQNPGLQQLPNRGEGKLTRKIFQ